MPAYADSFLLKFSPKNRQLLAIVLPVIAGAVLGGHMLIKPILKKISSAQTEKASYSQKESVYTSILSLDKKMDPYRINDGKLVDKASIIEQLSSFATKSGLTINSISPDEKKASLSDIDSLLIRIEAEGNYHQTAEFIAMAESLKTHIRVTSLEINRDSPGDQVALLTPVATTAPKNSKAYKIALALTVFFGLANT